MKIYTKKGDLGKTSIIGQKSINKHNVRIEAYGSVDELNSHMGLIRSFKSKDLPDIESQITDVQNNLFVIGAALATKKNSGSKYFIDEESIEKLENYIDIFETKLKPLTAFILPGGDVWSSHIQIARSVCRRAERRITQMNENLFVDPRIIKYINRLSDYLFVLSRLVSQVNKNHEIEWHF